MLKVRDPRKIKRLLVVNDVSARQLAAGVGWKSHTSMNRLLAGAATHIAPERAEAIARYLHVDVDDLFVPVVSTDAAQTVSSGRAS